MVIRDTATDLFDSAQGTVDDASDSVTDRVDWDPTEEFILDRLVDATTDRDDDVPDDVDSVTDLWLHDSEDMRRTMSAGRDLGSESLDFFDPDDIAEDTADAMETAADDGAPGSSPLDRLLRRAGVPGGTTGAAVGIVVLILILAYVGVKAGKITPQGRALQALA